MNSNYSNLGPIDRDAQRLSLELDAVSARGDGDVAAARTVRRSVSARLRAAVMAVRDVLDGITAANELHDRLNRPWVYEGAAWVNRSDGPAGRPSEASRAALRAAC